MRQVAPIGFLCALVGLMAWGIQDWYKPTTPVLIMLGMLIAFFAARYTWDTFKSEKEMTLKELLPTPVEVIAAVVALGLSALWIMAPVRAGAVKFASIQSRLNVEKALTDSSHTVKVAACLELFDIGVAKSATKLLEVMDKNPEMADHCFAEAKKKGLATADYMSDKLSQRWLHMIMTQNLNQTPPVCEYIKPYENITNEHTKLPGKANLLACATGSINGKTRECCAAHLNKRGNLAVYMGSAESFPRDVGGQVYPILAALTFKYGLLDDENKKLADALTTPSEPTKRWVAQLGCSLARGDSSSVDGIRGLISFVEGGPCRPKENEARLLFSKTETWDLACEVVDNEPEDKPIEASMCKGMERALVGLAVEEAKARLNASARTWYLMAIAAASDGRMGMYHGNMNWAARKKLWNALADGKLSFGELNRSDLWQAYGFNSRQDLFNAGLFQSLPMVDDFLRKDPKLKQELESFYRFDAKDEDSSKKYMNRTFSFVGDILNGKDATVHALPLNTYNKIRQNKEGYAKSKDLMANTMDAALGKSTGSTTKLNSGSSRSSGGSRSRGASRTGTPRGSISIEN